ncbi:MAG: hypothetical protein MJY79_08060 [Bacteroidaceae bacterium]|nr:hypothetical protein [Bacteroidaceae bacterium]
MRKSITITTLFLLMLASALSAGNYENFRTTAYVMVGTVNRMSDQAFLDQAWEDYSKNLALDKVYLEVFRDGIFVNEDALKKAIKFFKSKGVEVAGGVTYNNGGGVKMRWESFCYNNPEHRATIRKAAEINAKYFDEFVLDDYYFTNCRCEVCAEEKDKSGLSWSDYRMKLLDDAAKELIVDAAHKINRKCKVIIKYPNWYEHFHGLGFDLKNGPYTFDGIYTGTETRNPAGEQHLQPYESYAIVRYFENLRPGYNHGGWVDTGSMSYFDMFPEQLWLTLLAKAPEISLFNFSGMRNQFRNQNRPWADMDPTFNMQEMMEESKARGVENPTWGRVAEYSYRQVDKILGKLGTPKGIPSYRPHYSIGEDFLQMYMGMCGVPVELVPEFPENSKMVILTEEAAQDKDIVAKMKKFMKNGGDVIITSGLLKALQGNGIEEIVELNITDRKALVDTILVGTRRAPAVAKATITIPQITYMTNDSWEDISTLDYGNGWPLMQQISYANGNMFVWVIPENFSHLYALPDAALNRIRTIADKETGVRIEGPSQIALLTYDNGTFVVESFLDKPVTINIVTDATKSLTRLEDGSVLQGRTQMGERMYGRQNSQITRYQVTIPPHSFKGFKKNY